VTQQPCIQSLMSIYGLDIVPPSYLLRTDMSPSGSSGVWGMMRRIRRTPSEGLPGLWKGQILTTMHSLLSNNLQPLVHSGLIISLPPPTATAQMELNSDLDLPLASYHNPMIPLGLHVTAHLLTHMFLSPLELLRTRLIVQPSSDPKSKSSIGLLKDAVSDEGGVVRLYTHPQLLIPAILEHTLRPIFTLSIPLIIERKFGVTPDSSPVTYSMLDLSLGLASLLVILPIETVRKRLQLQDRMSETDAWQRGGKREKRKSIVRLRKREYHGLLDTIWRIMSEETGTPKKKRSKRRGSRTEQTNAVDEHERQRAAFDGIKQLYRGVSFE
jgi:fusion and transport protein UGO1